MTSFLSMRLKVGQQPTNSWRLLTRTGRSPAHQGLPDTGHSRHRDVTPDGFVVKLGQASPPADRHVVLGLDFSQKNPQVGATETNLLGTQYQLSIDKIGMPHREMGPVVIEALSPSMKTLTLTRSLGGKC